MLKPSERIRRVLIGKVRLEDEDASIQSVCSKYIYDAAISILSMKQREARQKALAKLPELIRPHIEDEVWRIHKRRKLE
jgi:hypothetical protein